MDPRTAFDRREELQFLDVREKDEWDAGHIEGSAHIPMDSVPDRLDQIDRGRPVVAVCRSGRRSGLVAAYLSRAGFTVHNMTGGLEQWEAEGLPLTGRRTQAG
ncbi:rhodanese-like domain-containing protein [Actinopolymorpha sp. B11F2]|uniref:rhodanese-like domain-containing protein n=1 Tax=Actinopolymorpha sp. B11F2 TaxID=3160862 RepID=UPI0032E4F4D2